MSLESDIREAVAFTGLPCVKGEYTGTEKAYMVINYTTLPAHYSDDTPEFERQMVQLHLFCPVKQNTVALRAGVKRALHAAGYSFPTTEDSSDATGQHIVFEFEGLEAI